MRHLEASSVHSNTHKAHESTMEHIISCIKDIMKTFASDEYNENTPLTRDAIKYNTSK
jgi:hypothetical protein